jgi:hypothetical protein
MLLIQKVENDTRDTASNIRRLLSQLDLYMVIEAKNNIFKFNECIINQINTLFSRGEISNYIITNFLLVILPAQTRNLSSIWKNGKRVMKKLKTLFTK